MNLRRWKLIKSTLVTFAFFGFAVFSIQSGANPTATGSLTIVVVALYNGVEWSELVQAGQGIGIQVQPLEEDDQE